MDSLKVKTAKNLGIVYVANLITTIFGTVASIILARLLTPWDFGLIALSGIIIAVITTFVQDLGFNAALIQRQKNIEEAANIVFYTTIAINFFLFSVILLIAPFAADFFHEEKVTDIIRISALGLIIGAFSAGHSGLMIKKLEYGAVMKISIISSVLSSSLSVILAFLGFSYWSLVYGSLLVAPLTVILYWQASSWRPKISYNKKIAREMIGFGGLVTVINILWFFISEIDKLFIGKFLNTYSLGIYKMGYNWGLIGANNIAGVLFGVLFPTFSTIQNEKKKIWDAYLKAFKYTNLLTIPISLGTIAIAPEFVTFILGEKWIESIPIIQIFAVYGLFYSAGIPSASVFLALGKAKLAAKITAVQTFFVLLFIYPSLLWQGTAGVVLCLTAAMMIIYFLIKSMLACSILDAKFSELIKSITGSIIASVIMFFCIIWVKMLIGSSFFTLFIFIFIGILIYSMIIFLIDREVFREVKEILFTLKK